MTTVVPFTTHIEVEAALARLVELDERYPLMTSWSERHALVTEAMTLVQRLERTKVLRAYERSDDYLRVMHDFCGRDLIELPKPGAVYIPKGKYCEDYFCSPLTALDPKRAKMQLALLISSRDRLPGSAALAFTVEQSRRRLLLYLPCLGSSTYLLVNCSRAQDALHLLTRLYVDGIIGGTGHRYTEGQYDPRELPEASDGVYFASDGAVHNVLASTQRHWDLVAPHSDDPSR